MYTVGRSLNRPSFLSSTNQTRNQVRDSYRDARRDSRRDSSRDYKHDLLVRRGMMALLKFYIEEITQKYKENFPNQKLKKSEESDSKTGGFSSGKTGSTKEATAGKISYSVSTIGAKIPEGISGKQSSGTPKELAPVQVVKYVIDNNKTSSDDGSKDAEISDLQGKLSSALSENYSLASANSAGSGGGGGSSSSEGLHSSGYE